MRPLTLQRHNPPKPRRSCYQDRRQPNEPDACGTVEERRFSAASAAFDKQRLQPPNYFLARSARAISGSFDNSAEYFSHNL